MPRTAAVIGSGFGGLALAIRLQSAGLQTTIHEKRDLPGGRAYVFRDQGYTFDAGPTVITAPECFEELWARAGKRFADYVKLVPLSPFYRLEWDDGYRFDYHNDEQDTFDQIRRKNPADVDGFRRFLDYSKQVYDIGYKQLVAASFESPWSMARVAPQLLRLQSFRSVYSMVSKYIQDEHLRQAFSFHPLLIGGNPFRASSIYTLIHYLERTGGVWFPMGGTHALIRGMVKLFEDIGGQIRYDAEIDRITTADGRVTGVATRDGRAESYDVVASNADVLHTYRHLLRDDASSRATARRLERMHQSMSVFVLYFGVKKTYPDLAHHTIIFGPRYQELLADIFERGVLPDDFSLYLHAPTRTDPSMAPPGCEAFYVLSPVANLQKGSVDWKTEAPRYADKLLAYLERTRMPGLREHLVTRRTFTPEDFRTELNSPVGAAFSLEPLLTQSAYFRTHNRDASLRGMYIVGAGTHPGAGVPGVVNSAKATMGVIQDDLMAGAFGKAG